MHPDVFNKLREVSKNFKSYKVIKMSNIQNSKTLKDLGEIKAKSFLKQMNKFEGMPMTGITLEKIYYICLSHGIRDVYFDETHGHLIIGKYSEEEPPSPYKYVYLDDCYMCEKIGLVSSGTGCCYECDKPHDKEYDEVQTKLWGEGMTEQQHSEWRKEYNIYPDD